jgi:hypothetical protein
MVEKVIVKETKNKVIISAPGPQGPGGRTILNGTGAPANNLGFIGDFYVNNLTHEFYGPKLYVSDWKDAVVVSLVAAGTNYAYSVSWEITQVVGPQAGIYSVEISHNLGFYPNATVKDSSGDTVETGIDYVDINKIKLTMAQPFSGTAYLS